MLSAENLREWEWCCRNEIFGTPSKLSMVAKTLCVKMLNGALHYSTGTERGSDVGFSSCTAPNYLVLVSKYFRCVLWTPRILEVSEWSGSSEVNPEWECSPERGEHRGQV